jgi:hypothetical protein
MLTLNTIDLLSNRSASKAQSPTCSNGSISSDRSVEQREDAKWLLKHHDAILECIEGAKTCLSLLRMRCKMSLVDRKPPQPYLNDFHEALDKINAWLEELRAISWYHYGVEASNDVPGTRTPHSARSDGSEHLRTYIKHRVDKDKADREEEVTIALEHAKNVEAMLR